MTDSRDFALIEYQKSVEAYFKGIEIGFGFSRVYFIINGLFFTTIGIILKFPDPGSRYSDVVDWVMYLIPVLGMVYSLSLIMLVAPYNRHLENCSSRSAELESEFEGKLFNKMRDIDREPRLNTSVALYIVFLSFLVLWACVFIAVIN